MKKIAVLGYGTVGSGVVTALERDGAWISRKLGEGIEVKAVLDLRDFPGNPVQEKIVHDFALIENDPEIAAVVEVMGGTNPAYDYSKRALLAGKHVITSNKELVEAKGAELGALAAQKGVSYFFEASVAGGIPILRTIHRALTQEKISRIVGILNGTTNYILDRMETEGLSFETALSEAQREGYAERNPEADIEGYDAARKIAILASMLCEKHVSYRDVSTKGIVGVTNEDLQGARLLGGCIKLIGSCHLEDGGLYSSVEPLFIPGDNMLTAVHGVYNAVMVRSSLLEDSMYYGQGAGRLATASAVVADLLEALGGIRSEIWSEETQEPMHPAERPCSYMLRVEGAIPAEELLEKTVPTENGFVALSYACTQAELESLIERMAPWGRVVSVYRKIEE